MPHIVHPEVEARWARRIIDEMSELRADARAAEADAEAMNQLATRLEDDAYVLRPLLGEVRSLHIDATWEGNSATRSRARLDMAERAADRIVRAVEETADVLRSRSRSLTNQANSAWAARRGLRFQLDDFVPEVLL